MVNDVARLDGELAAPGGEAARLFYNMPVLRLPVVIPALEEEAVIGDLLDHLSGLYGIDEVVVADGGSADATVGISRDVAGQIRGALEAGYAGGNFRMRYPGGALGRWLETLVLIYRRLGRYFGTRASSSGGRCTRGSGPSRRCR